MFAKSAEIFWSAERCLLQYRCVFCDASFQTHTECLKHLVESCDQSPQQTTSGNDFFGDDDFYELLTSHGHLPEFYKRVLVNVDLCESPIDDMLIDYEEDVILDADDDLSSTTCADQVDGSLTDNTAVVTAEVRGEKFTCDICGHQISGRHDLEEHMLRHHHNTTSSELPPVAANSKPKKYCCEFCGVRMADFSNMLMHKRKHTGEKPYPCGVCGKRFAGSYERRDHERIHSDERPFKCDLCGSMFKLKKTLRSHVRILHSDERPHKCDTCGRTFKTGVNYRHHMMTHTGERPYRCDVCGKSFLRRCAFQVHMNIHNDHRPYKCGQCDRGFHSTAARFSHEKIFHRRDHVVDVQRLDGRTMSILPDGITTFESSQIPANLNPEFEPESPEPTE